jgi:hypothetical protein
MELRQQRYVFSPTYRYIHVLITTSMDLDLLLPTATIPGSERRQYLHVLRNNTLRMKGNFDPRSVTAEITKRTVSVPPPGELLCASAGPSVLPFTFVLARQYDLDAKLPMSWRNRLKVLIAILIFAFIVWVSKLQLHLGSCGVIGANYGVDYYCRTYQYEERREGEVERNYLVYKSLLRRCCGEAERYR